MFGSTILRTSSWISSRGGSSLLPVNYPLGVDKGLGRVHTLKENGRMVLPRLSHKEHCFDSGLAPRQRGDGATELSSGMSRP